ncbi:MAG: hypothetical protein FJZ63_05170 [Chlamydiae bacterium]|nr:hypothetical protein [Chlamydiota bacterium]
MKKKVNPALSSAGLSWKERTRLEATLSPSLGGTTIYQKGIDKGELDRTMDALHKTPDRFKIMSEEKLKRAEKILRKNL